MIVKLLVDVPSYHLKIGDLGVIKKWWGNIAEVQFVNVLLIINHQQIKEK